MQKTEPSARDRVHQPDCAVLAFSSRSTAFCSLGLLFAAEIVFRHQLIDTYHAELQKLNSTAALSVEADVLFLGDSMTAGSTYYPSQLAKSEAFANVNVVNAAVSGFTARDAAMVAPGRVARFKPKVAVYQIYVGNDLLEIEPPKMGASGLARRTYWWTVNRGWRSLAWLNYRLRGFSPESLKARRLQEPPPTMFAPAKYQSRERRWIEEYPEYLLVQRNVDSESAWDRYQYSLSELTESLLKTADTVVLLVVPHCTEVSDIYRQRFEMMGLGENHQPPLSGGGEWRERLSAFAEARLQVELVDARAALALEEAKGNRTYLLNDPHLSDHGQTTLAQLLESVLLGVL